MEVNGGDNVMGKVLSITAGVLVGAAVGAGIVLLFAPQSGSDTQQMIRERIDAIVAEGQEAAEMRRLELTERFEALKQPGAPTQVA
jgi:gas vesicle protein